MEDMMTHKRLTKKAAAELYATIDRSRETLTWIHTQYTPEQRAQADGLVLELEQKIAAAQHRLARDERDRVRRGVNEILGLNPNRHGEVL